MTSSRDLNPTAILIIIVTRTLVIIATSVFLAPVDAKANTQHSKIVASGANTMDLT